MAGGTDGLPLHTRLLKKFNDDVPTDWSTCSIFRVPNHLRMIRKQAYEPQVISIGPYHHGKAPLNKMEVYKMYSLKMLLKRREESSLERYVTALKNREEQARKFYSEPLNHIGGENFVEMMLLDGCFIIELIRKIVIVKRMDKNDWVFLHFNLRRIKCDLLLFENQLPFSILSELFGMTVMPNEPEDFIGMAVEFFSTTMPGSLRRPNNQDIEHPHLLGLLHDSCCQALSSDCQVRISCSPEKVMRSLCPEVMLKAMAIPCLSSPSKSAEEDEKSESAKEDQEIETGPSASMSLCKFEILESSSMKSMVERDGKPASKPNEREWQFIRSATELSEAGINFRKIDGNLFDIKFQKGEMAIPTLRIDDESESLLRNLVAYEQCFWGASSNCFTDYIIFMDRLINNWKDVELLSHDGIIDNWLGDHKVVAAMFNKLFDHVSISEDFFYAKTFKEVNKHCGSYWNRMKANLWHNYFNTPWAGISFLAAVFLLLLTVLQSVYSVLSYKFK